MTDVLNPPVQIESDDHGRGAGGGLDDVHGHGHEEHHGPTGILKWITTTDHKVIGLSYTVTAVIMLVIGAAWAVFSPLTVRDLMDASRPVLTRSVVCGRSSTLSSLPLMK